MKFKIEIRYAVLLALLTLLWLSLEYMVGLQDEYAAWHPFISVLWIIIPAYCIRKTIKDIREEQATPLTFRQAFFAGFVMIIFASLLMGPIQIVFYQFINPDYFPNMITYAVRRAAELNQNIEKAKEQAQTIFNLGSYLLQSILGTFVAGTILSALLGWWYTRKR